MAIIALLGATGTMGRLIAREATRRGHQVVLAGRHVDELVELASTLPSGQSRAAIVDLGNPATLEQVISQADVVLNTVGPFNRFAAPIVAACLHTTTPYVDLSNELSAVRALLDRDADARQRGVPLVTGAGFGVVATETLALMLADASPRPLQSVQVVAAQDVAYATTGVQATIADSLAQGSPRYLDGGLVAAPFGEGATTLQLGGAPRQVVPAPTGDLVAAQRATGAPDVVAYVPVPGERGSAGSTRDREFRSVAFALGRGADGTHIEADLRFGEGFEASATIAVEVAVRTAADAPPGAWTPGQLFGSQLAPACGAVVAGPRA
jgi:saccharopine dehydrogenase (NAD+, L-lysine-forming)